MKENTYNWTAISVTTKSKRNKHYSFCNNNSVKCCINLPQANKLQEYKAPKNLLPPCFAPTSPLSLGMVCPLCLFSDNVLTQWQLILPRHGTLHTLSNTMQTPHSWMHIVHCLLRLQTAHSTAHWRLQIAYWKLQTVHCTIHTQHSTLHNAYCTLHPAHCTLLTAYCTLSMHLYTAHCSLHTVNFTIHTALGNKQ